MAARQDKGYRRSWKNLLINKRYQLRFTLFMVGLSAFLMLGLGMWVLREARIATTVGINDVRGRNCGDAAGPGRGAGAADVPVEPAAQAEPDVVPAAPEDTAGAADAPDEEAEPGEPGEAGEQAAAGEPGEGEAGIGAERPRIQVEIGDMKLEPPVVKGADMNARMAEVAECRKQQEEQVSELKTGYLRIKMVLLAFGVLMVLGLTVYGLKTTHKVAGPLHKVSLYFDKLREGVYDEVYSLRRGDQLVEFYEQFRAAHGGLREMEERDIAVLRSVLEAAEKAGLAKRSPELAALLDDMKKTLARKEKSIE